MRRRDYFSVPSRASLGGGGGGGVNTCNILRTLLYFFCFVIFLGRNHINVISVIRLSQEDGDVPEGGGWGVFWKWKGVWHDSTYK